MVGHTKYNTETEYDSDTPKANPMDNPIVMVNHNDNPILIV